MWSDWKEQIKHQPKVRHSLLWEYDLCSFDWQYMRALVVERVIERGWDEDYYALFALYGGMDGVRQIIRDEVLILSDKDIAFVCTAFNLKKGGSQMLHTQTIVKYELKNIKHPIIRED